MPSDPSGVSPKGTLIRPPADFFDDHLAVGSFFLQFTGGPNNSNFCTVALFNNANTGVVFKVYGISAVNDGGSGMGAFWFYGPLGALYAPCQPIRPDLGAPFGQIWQQTTLANVPAAPNPYFTPPYVNLIGVSGFDSNTILSPFPLFIVPVGWSLVLTNVTASADLGAGFWYQQANE